MAVDLDKKRDGISEIEPVPPVNDPVDTDFGAGTGAGPGDEDFIGPLPPEDEIGDPATAIKDEGINDPTPPITEEVPKHDIEDFSGEVGENTVDPKDKMDYDVPEVGDAPFVTDSGTADPTMTPWDVTEEQTVAGQLEKLYDRDSPFFEQARQRAIRQSLAGGGQNSAMAAGFGELAAMDVAFQVAGADAATYARSAEFNAAMSNQFSLAEQRFIHNALLSDQSFKQAGALQTQRIEGQMEAIMLDYQGRSVLMDQEMQNWFLQAKQTYEYTLGTMYEQAALGEGQAGRDFARTMTLNGMTSMTNFAMNSFNSILEYAGNPNFTPEQQQAAMLQGQQWWSAQWDMMQAYWGQYAAGGPPLDSFTGGTNSPFNFGQPYTGG